LVGHELDFVGAICALDWLELVAGAMIASNEAERTRGCAISADAGLFGTSSTVADDDV
jgi:hypothetical protein